MFTTEEFIERCRAAVAEQDAQKAVREVVAEAMSEPAQLATALRAPAHAGIVPLYRSPDLTILDFTWAPWMCLKPHNHCMWSVVGIFSGREDNVFWRRTAHSIEAAGARSLGTGDGTPLG